MTEKLALWIIWATAPAATAVPILYAFTARWWRSLAGKALMASTAALALLVDLALLFRSWGGHLAFKQDVAVGVYALICLGAWLMLASLLAAQVRAIRERRAR